MVVSEKVVVTGVDVFDDRPFGAVFKGGKVGVSRCSIDSVGLPSVSSRLAPTGVGAFDAAASAGSVSVSRRFISGIGGGRGSFLEAISLGVALASFALSASTLRVSHMRSRTEL